LPNILYKARNDAGDEVAGFVDANTAQDAVAQLKASGLADIELHESPGNAATRTDRATRNESQAEQLAAFELKVRERPGLKTLLTEVARRARWYILAAAALVVASLAWGRAWPALAGAAVLAITFGVPAWRHRYSRYFQRMLQALALGQWDEARHMLDRFAGKKHSEAITASIPFYDAQIRVRQGEPLERALARVEAVRGQFPPGQFPARAASLHGAAKDYDGFIACMREAWELTPDDPSRRVDYALAHARLGDLAQAQELLDGVDMETLQVNGRPFVWWARGLVDLRNDKPSAEATLMQGVEGFLRIASPAAWTSLALCSGACALAMVRNGDRVGATTMLKRVWPVLKVHADTRLQGEVETEIGLP
jgi:tetratricopeptide (TPR) repeat protein